MQALLALCRLHVVPVWPSRLVSLSSSSPLLLAYRCRPYLLCAACMWCLFGPPDWSVCHPVALFYLPTGAGPTCSACLTGQLSPGCGQHSVQHSCSVQLGCQAWCSKDACTVQRFRQSANQVPALYVLSAYNVIAGVDPDPSIQATKTFLSRLAINLMYVHHCTRLYLTRCNTVDSRYRRTQLSVLYREVPLIQR